MLRILNALVVYVLLATANCSALASPITYEFLATDFVSLLGTPVPQATVSGSVTFDGTAITAFDMTIGSKTYSVVDVMLIYWNANEWAIGGNESGMFMSFGADDFSLVVDHVTPDIGWLTYSVAGTDDLFASPQGAGWVSAASIPEPTSMLLVATGLMVSAGRWAIRRRTDSLAGK